MAPLPKKRHSRGRQGKRRAAISLSIPKLVECSNCKALKLPHEVCPSCGVYRNRVTLTPKTGAGSATQVQTKTVSK